MKIIEAMKKVKANKEKILDLQNRIGAVSAHLSHETPLYGDKTKEQINEWIQSCLDTAQESVRLLTAISATNLATPVTIELGEKRVTKTIAEWVWRRREYAALDMVTYSKLTDRNLREGQLTASTPGGQPFMVTIVRNYDPVKRDEATAMYRNEPHAIDAALEVVNATTDLIEDHYVANLATPKEK